MLTIDLIKTRTGTLSAVIQTTSRGAPYEIPPVHREVIDFGIEDSVSEVFRRLGERVAGLLEEHAQPAVSLLPSERFSELLQAIHEIRPKQLHRIGFFATERYTVEELSVAVGQEMTMVLQVLDERLGRGG